MSGNARFGYTLTATACFLVTLSASMPAVAGEGDSESAPAVEILDEDTVDPATAQGAQDLKPSVKSPDNLVEWFGMTLGMDYVSNTNPWVKADLLLFTISRKDWYYTVLDIGLWLVSGSSGVGGRIGWQKFIAPNMAFRVGLKSGFAEWAEAFVQTKYGQPGEYEYVACIHNGVELTPHVQFVWFGKHGTAGVGIDIPILFSVMWLTLFDDFNSSHVPHPVAGGVGVYFRWSVF